jgi:anti-sigma B factor antagonist
MAMSNSTKFEVNHKQENELDFLYLRGYLDAHTAPDLEDAIGNLVRSGKHKIVINLRDLDYISSAGLGVFMAFIEEIRESGGDIKLAELKPKVFTVFDLLGFPMLFDIEPNEKDIILMFAENPGFIERK